MAKTNNWLIIKAREVFVPVADKSHNGELQVLSATQDRGIVPRTEMDIDIKFDEKSLPTYKKVSKGNFVIHLRSFQGGLAYSKVEGIISPAYTILEPIQPICDEFYEQFFKSSRYIKQLEVAIYGIRDGKQISYEDFGRLSIPFPPLAEQRAIAEILTTADCAITLRERLITAKREQKHWLMQKLLTGKMRLPGFSGEWERTPFSDFFVSNSIFTDDLEKYPLYSLTIENGVTAKTERYERGHLVLKEEAYKVIQPDDYAYNPMNVRFGAVARYKGKIPVCVSGYYDIFRCKYNADSGFFDSFLTSPFMIKYYNKVSTGSLVEKQRVHFSQFMNFCLPMPSSEERKAMATVFTTADREIDLLNRQLEQQRQVKKYLMQQLLTGRIRVGGAAQ